jgi:GNAT superfamily N-acetyltransferase
LRTRRLPHGLAVFHDPAPMLWDLNHVIADNPAAPLPVLAAEAEQAQRELPHRMVVLDGDAEAIAREARATGWIVERHVAMVWRREPDRAAPSHPVREVDLDVTAPARRTALRQEPWGEPATVEAVLGADRLLRAPRREREFASFAVDRPAAVAKLYADSSATIGQVEDVVTLPAFRNLGHARAVVLAAAQASRDAGHELTFLWADEDDWPRKLYLKLGFDVVGRRWRLCRLAGDSAYSQRS